jgi:monoamine oxidase
VTSSARWRWGSLQPSSHVSASRDAIATRSSSARASPGSHAGPAGHRGILGAYLRGRIAEQVTSLAPRERERFVLDRMEHVHPGLTEQFETGASYSWIEDPWARGAGVEFHPGQMPRYYQTLRAPEGRIFFAGEYTSAWSSWMNGALESGERAATAIAARDA